MPQISKEKINKIKEQILYFLYTQFPKQPFTADIAKEIARDEEFIKKLLLEMDTDSLVVQINKNNEGIKYVRRIRWRISNKAHQVYSENQ
jgi:predicted transcriptional regulator with HTH domain